MASSNYYCTFSLLSILLIISKSTAKLPQPKEDKENHPQAFAGAAPPQASTSVLPLNNFDDRSLLDLFGEVSKDYFTTSFFPPTDDSCDWSWRNGRCEPACACRLRYKFGDFHLGRSCRKRTNVMVDGEGGEGEGSFGNDYRGDNGEDYDEEDDEEDNEDEDHFDDSPPPNCSSPPLNSLYYKAITAAIKEGKSAKSKVQRKLNEVKPRKKICEAVSGRELRKVGVVLPEFNFCKRLESGVEHWGDEEDKGSEDGGNEGDENGTYVKGVQESEKKMEREREKEEENGRGNEVEEEEEEELEEEEEEEEEEERKRKKKSTYDDGEFRPLIARALDADEESGDEVKPNTITIIAVGEPGVEPIQPPASWMDRDPPKRQDPNPPRSRQGNWSDICIATILSCGLGGCNCNESDVSTHMRCCRVDTHNYKLVFAIGCLTGCCVCGYWNEWAGDMHIKYNVSYYPYNIPKVPSDEVKKQEEKKMREKEKIERGYY